MTIKKYVTNLNDFDKSKGPWKKGKQGEKKNYGKAPKQFKQYEALLAKGDALRKQGQKGKPITIMGEVRNQCWNCNNFPREINPKGDKGYYKCEYCGGMMHQ